MKIKSIFFFLCLCFSVHAQNKVPFSSIELKYTNITEEWIVKNDVITQYNYMDSHGENIKTAINYNTDKKITKMATAITNSIGQTDVRTSTSFFYQNNRLQRVQLIVSAFEEKDTIEAIITYPKKRTVEATIQALNTRDSSFHFVHITKNENEMITEFINERIHYDRYAKKPSLSIERINSTYANENAIALTYIKEEVLAKSIMNVEKNSTEASFIDKEDIMYQFHKENHLAYLFNALLLKECTATKSLQYQNTFKVESFVALSKNLSDKSVYQATNYPVVSSIKNTKIKDIIKDENEKGTVLLSYTFNKDGHVATRSFTMESLVTTETFTLNQTYTYKY